MRVEDFGKVVTSPQWGGKDKKMIDKGLQVILQVKIESFVRDLRS